jgi:cellulose synthase/poly-beta-1,6-N-acetylglucosamine synthase-like glycosyltransferase
VASFRRGPSDLVCVQARLNVSNTKQSWLTRFFTADYFQRFDLYLPGLQRARAPIPLSGSSNHVRHSTLRELGYWDPFNVAEDADLGLRIARSRLRTGTIASTTYQEATAHLAPWVRQRSRWSKGYMQTWLVHMRRPVQLWRELGAASWLHCQLIVAGPFIPLLTSPFFLGVLIAWGFGAPALPRPLLFAAAVNAVTMNAVSATLNVVGLLRRGRRDLAPWMALYPLYSLLLSVATRRGLVELVRRPSYWEKTPHELADPAV